MNPNVWNIKDLFSVPPGTGGSKSSGRNGTGDHSSLTDSQFLFGSQLCADISQPSTIDYKQMKNSQQNSQENDSSLFLKYQTKPNLFNSDPKEKSSFSLFGTAKQKGILDQYEESKKKTKEKLESEQLHNLISSIQLTIQELKTALCQIEENAHLRSTSLVDSMNAGTKTLQDNASLHCESILKVLSAKCNVEQALEGFEQKLHTNGEEMADLKSNMQLLLSNMDALKSQQCEQQVILSEKISWLSDYIKSSEDKIISELQKINLVPLRLKDNSAQTSPAAIPNISLKNHVEPPFSVKTTLPERLPLLQGNIQPQTNGTSNAYSADPEENVSESTDCVKNSSSGCEFSNISEKGPTSRRKAVRIPTVSYNATQKHTQKSKHENSYDSSGNLFKNVDSSFGKENAPRKNVAKENGQRNGKRGTANKHKTNYRKKPSGSSRRKNTDAASRTLAKTSKVKSRNEPVSLERGTSVIISEADCLSRYTESCGSSLPVIHAPLRKAQKKNRDQLSVLSSHQRTEQQSSAKRQPYAGDKTGLYTKEKKMFRWDFSTQEGMDLRCSLQNESHLTWFCPSSPLLEISPSHPATQFEERNFMSVFFGSSDDSD
ncbi:interactor of HORMAD1 protein 1 [Spea bombifrons]|uniref:interactor of HORMAD1 protein 1 n=1 Tax=Spea bombifrons TaxID=233779 RepID=UPI00234ADDDF|nr:interactor of HORMAD1 protein 1 [Spea bombifrons]